VFASGGRVRFDIVVVLADVRKEISVDLFSPVAEERREDCVGFALLKKCGSAR